MTAEVFAGAVGAGLGTATIWFPIIYFAARNELELRRDLGRAWLPYACCVLAFALLHLLGAFPSTETAAGLVWFFILPPSVCAIILYATFRSAAASPLNPFRCRSERARVTSLLIAAAALLAWLLWIGAASNGFVGIKPLGWALVFGVPVAVFAVARFAVTAAQDSKRVRLLLVGSVLWVFAVAAWGFIANWESHFDTQRYAALFLLPPLGGWLAHYLWRWATSRG